MKLLYYCSIFTIFLFILGSSNGKTIACEENTKCTQELCNGCPLLNCVSGSILVEGAGICGCCPGCVFPEEGHRCYKVANKHGLTCGETLSCRRGICKRS